MRPPKNVGLWEVGEPLVNQRNSSLAATWVALTPNEKVPFAAAFLG